MACGECQKCSPRQVKKAPLVPLQIRKSHSSESLWTCGALTSEQLREEVHTHHMRLRDEVSGSCGPMID